MTSWIIRAFAAALAAAGIAAASAQPLVVAGTVSQSGPLADLAADYRKALLLWQDEVNGAGGIAGRPVELKLLDDASEAIQVGKLYLQLIGEKPGALIGPYGSAASLMASAEAEAARRVIVNGAAASGAVHKRSPRYVFQAGIPYSAYGAGVLDIAKASGYRKVFIVTRDDLVPREMAAATREAALKLGLEAGDVEIHAGGITDFGPQVARARAFGADAWIAFGETRDAAEMVKNFRRLGYAPRLFFARAAADSRFISSVGQDAEFVLAVIEYAPRFPTPGNDKFVKAFAAKWSAPPGPAAAEGYAAATVLGEALRRAGSDQQKLREMLSSSAVPTVLGGYQVDAKTGEQTAAKPAVVQILKGRPELVWPSMDAIKRALPYPQWSERRPLKKEAR
jgi:branched-chain amino acid transport system substrate-binding protein